MINLKHLCIESGENLLNLSAIEEVPSSFGNLHTMSLVSPTRPCQDILANIQVLKLKFHVFVGKDWETSQGIFPSLKFLKLEELDIVTWTAFRNHFPVLQCLKVHRCPYMMELPEDFGNICTLEQIELSGCTDAATNSARNIQKEQENNRNDWLKIRLNPRLTKPSH